MRHTLVQFPNNGFGPHEKLTKVSIHTLTEEGSLTHYDICDKMDLSPDLVKGMKVSLVLRGHLFRGMPALKKEEIKI